MGSRVWRAEQLLCVVEAELEVLTRRYNTLEMPQGLDCAAVAVSFVTEDPGTSYQFNLISILMRIRLVGNRGCCRYRFPQTSMPVPMDPLEEASRSTYVTTPQDLAGRSQSVHQE